MARQSRFIFSALLSLLVLLVFAFAFSLSILLADTDSLSDINFVINKEQQRNTISKPVSYTHLTLPTNREV